MKQNKFAHWIALMAYALTIFFTLPVFGQGPPMVCKDTVNVSPSQDCIASLDAFTALYPDSTSYTDSFLLLLQTIAGDPIAMSSETIDLPAFEYLGSTLKLVVVHQPTMDSCSSILVVSDDQPPTISCPTDTVSCVSSIDPGFLKEVEVSDNCMEGVVLSFVDNTIGPDCTNLTPYIYAVVREWTATDAGGNSASCSQTILIKRAALGDVEFPANMILDCSGTADTSVTGRPAIDGIPILPGGFCNIAISVDEGTIPLCGSGTQILRFWTATDTCTSSVKIDTQSISLLDMAAPQITCEALITISTDPGKCAATIDLPLPAVSDDCSSVTIEAEITGVGTGLHYQNLPKGQYEVKYTATDGCLNDSTCTSVLQIVDTQTPSAVCEDVTIVSLSNSNTAVVYAETFDDGSNDNCAQELTFSVSRDSIAFGPTITFTCADIVAPVVVFLKVAETNNPDLVNVCKTFAVVQNMFPPAITCPLPQTINCEDELPDLDQFGSPTVSQVNCELTYVVTENDEIDISNCGVGTIHRNFTVAFANGDTMTCTQVITVENQTPFDGSTIEWPADYTLFNACPQVEQLHPDSLPNSPVNYRKPVISGSGCAMIATSYSDQKFDVAYPACYKIVRTWKVIDWCQCTENGTPSTIWTHQQIIAVMDSIPPALTCPPDITVGVGNNCDVAQVSLPPVTATDCSPNLTYTNNSPYNGANASGIYPLGVHQVTFVVKDGCGNWSTCSTKITVTDLKKPTPYANSGIVAELQEMGGLIMATVQASQFNHNSFDNCTPKEDLLFAIRLVGDSLPPTSSLTFDCTGEGIHEVEFWVTDAAGNTDYCITNFIVQDNMQLCPDTLVAGNITVAGEIKTELGEKLPSVKVNLPNMGMQHETNNNGAYTIIGLQPGSSYTVVPEKNTGPLNGVTTFDLVLMGRHILGISPFDSPYKIIAADINKSGSVTTSDMVELRKLILQIYSELPNNDSWRFVAENYVFPDPANPFSQPFPEALVLNYVDQNVLDANFVGVKIGDLNNSAVGNVNNGDLNDRSDYENLTIWAEDKELEAGEEIVLPFRLKEYRKLLALQFTLEFETNYLELQSIEEGALPAAAKESFGQSLLGQGVLTAAWFQTYPQAIDAEEALFSLRFKAKQAGRLSEMLAMSSHYTEAIAYDADEMAMNPGLAFANQGDDAANSFHLYQNQPNPFKNSTSIGFNLPEPAQAKLTIYDLSGKILKICEGQFESGYNRVTIEREELPAGGVLFYQLETNGHRATKKMVLIQ